MIKNNSPHNKASKNSAIVIGAGIGGLYAAWKLCKEGFAITVLERQTSLEDLPQAYFTMAIKMKLSDQIH